MEIKQGMSYAELNNQFVQMYPFLKLRFFQHPLVQIHLAVFLWGFTAILGKLITIDTLGLVST